jgi:hypothetical protein
VKRAAIIAVVAAAAVLLVAWIARNTRWEETKLPLPPKGEALTNPFYATQRLAAVLGGNPVHDRVFVTPPPGAVVVLSSWHWTLGEERQHALERWVESGGRLVVEGSLIGGEREFERWAGIERRIDTGAPRRETAVDPQGAYCDTVQEVASDPDGRSPATTGRVICDLNEASSLTSSRPAVWSLKGRSGVQAVRVMSGRGSVTWINAVPFRGMNIFSFDHPWVFVAATEFRKGDEVHFLSEEDHRSLFALIWFNGAPVVVLALTMVALLLWRGGVRLGPLAAEEPAARRSLAEQIRGTARFTLRNGGGAPLHGAAVRSLDEAAARHISGYTQLAPTERTTALAAVTPFTREALDAAIHEARRRRLHELRNTLAALETARRHLLRDHMKATHAAD